MITRKVILGFLALLFFEFSQAQSCTEQLIATYKVLSEKSMPENYDTFHAQYSIEQESWEGKKVFYKFKLYSDGNRNYMFSDDYKVCSDSVLTVTVQDDQKIIYIGASLDAEDRQKAMDRILQIQPKSFEIFNELSCENVSKEGKEKTLLKLECSTDYRKVYHISDVVYEFDSEFIYKVTINFTADYSLKKMVYRIKKMETNLEYADLNKEPSDFILEPDGELQSKYAT